MFSYDTLMARRNFELFLNSEQFPLKEHPIQRQKKQNILEGIINYFTGKSKIWYTYKVNEDTEDVEYSYPRSFSRDMNNLRDYFTELLGKA